MRGDRVKSEGVDWSVGVVLTGVRPPTKTGVFTRSDWGRGVRE
jgi:hypothetical protein